VSSQGGKRVRASRFSDLKCALAAHMGDYGPLKKSAQPAVSLESLCTGRYPNGSDGFTKPHHKVTRHQGPTG